MFPMKKEKPPVKSDAERKRERKQAARENDLPKRPESEARARELVERHRETLDYLSKN
jgi:hypothetical protein